MNSESGKLRHHEEEAEVGEGNGRLSTKAEESTAKNPDFQVLAKIGGS